MRPLSEVLKLSGIRAILVAVVCSLGAVSAQGQMKEYKSGLIFAPVKVVDPGPPGGPPADAIVLFDGKSLAQWEGGDKWIVKDGCATAAKQGIHTKKEFGDCQLHVEWAAPEKIEGSGQGRGNSGVYFMGLYEVQILDSYNNETYPDGQAGAIYKQSPPLVNVCRKPGQWQSFDIIFTAPRFDGERLQSPAAMTVLHNGVLIQNHFELEGETSWYKKPAYKAHAPKLPLHLQYHGDAVRFRNIWIRELVPREPPKREKGK